MDKGLIGKEGLLSEVKKVSSAATIGGDKMEKLTAKRHRPGKQTSPTCMRSLSGVKWIPEGKTLR